MFTDAEACYRAVQSRDRRFDGRFFTAVATTGIYCRPSCPARTPAPQNVTFHPTAASAQAAGYRACKRCLPDATPGSPEWDVKADLAGRAMRLIADGVLDRDGVTGLAQRLGYTTRHLGRVLTAELGAGPLALARAQRVQTARVLIETTTLTMAEIAYASGFGSIRQFNDTVRDVYASSPSQLRGRRRAASTARGELVLSVPVRSPFAGSRLWAFLAARAVPGVEVVEASENGGSYARSLDLPHGPALLRLELRDEPRPGVTVQVPLTLWLTDVRDTSAALERVRRLLDADCDPVAVDDALRADLRLAPLVAAVPGLRVPGHVDGAEVAVRAVLGQQVSVAAARTQAGRLAASYGKPLASSQVDGVTHLFPSAQTLAAIDPELLPMPRARGRALLGLCAALADGQVVLDRGADRAEVRRQLLALPGIGPWTADYIALRALGDPDVFLSGDLVIRHAMTALGVAPEEMAAVAAAWRPWGSYALMQLWGWQAEAATRRSERKVRDVEGR
ncbi:DNA-3-methyladenine glycosylase 2 family protein [Nocardioides sp. Bht2]|uniref:DNA-3-methyladenine glycosylase 2 family protein n=1 Tax=Nocardioides sp. Bht2 TaxID=3392297 RepID=UPI0039B6D985